MKINYRFGEFYLETSSRNLLHQGKLIRLSPKAFEILLLLIQHQGQAVGKDKLIDLVWTDSFVEDNNLAVHISALRRVLKETISGTKFIETISGYGYRFLPSVEELRNDGFSGLLKNQSLIEEEPRSLAILPFMNKSNDSKFDYLAEGIAESLILNLSQLSQLKVIAYSAVARYKDEKIDLQEVGFLLGVEAVLIGNIVEIDETLEIGVELIKVSNLSHLWGMQYQCRFEQLLKTRTKISMAIAEKLHLKLTKTEVRQLGKQPTENSDAYKLYLKGWNLAEKRTKEGLLKGIEYFNKALELDSHFALAFAEIANSYNSLGNFSLLPVDEVIFKSNYFLQKALEIDENLSEAHAALGLLQLYNSKIIEARDSFAKAVELNPNSSIAYSYYSAYLTATLDSSSSIFYQNKAIELNPFILSRVAGLTTRLNLLRKYNEAITNAEEVLELFPNNDLSYFSLAYSYVHLGNFDLALKNIETSYQLAPRADTHAFKGYIYAVSGKRKEVLIILSELLDGEFKDLVDYCDIAVIYGVLGDNNKAFEYLEKAFDSKFSHLFLLKVDPRFDPLRSDKRFDPLLKRIGLN